jgi:uncharacterized repeat protein (TIGR03803 family)
LSSTGEFSRLHAFIGSAASPPDGAYPSTGLTRGSDGNFYGTTQGGGASLNGTIFRVTPAGELTLLYSFIQNDGFVPDGRLLEVSPGVFVGTTYGGGASGGGVVFRATLANATTTSLSVSPGAAVFGQAVAMTATVTGATAPPDGSVEFFDGTISLGTAGLTAGANANSRQASFATSGLNVGTHNLSARYSGTSLPSTSSSVGFTVSKAQTSVVLAAQPNAAVRKQTVTLTGTVAATAPGSGTPTGQVQLFEGKKKLGTVALVNGIASFSLVFNGMGQHLLSAIYGGDVNFGGSQSSPLTVTVIK